MKILGKPENKWGWVRIAGWAALAGVVGWTAVAAVLSGQIVVPGMAWNHYQTFSLMENVERAIVPLMLIAGAGWLEEQDARIAEERSTHQASELAAAENRQRELKRFREEIVAALPNTDGKSAVGLPAKIPPQNQSAVCELIRDVLAKLDGKGKGELLHFLYGEGLLSGDMPAVELAGADFSGAAFHDAPWIGICLEGANLAGARIDSAHLVKGRLARANLSRAFLRLADLREAGLAGSDLTQANLEGANLEGANLRGACLDGAFLRNANLKNSDLESLDQAVLIETVLPDGQKITNDKGKAFLKNKEIAFLIDRL